MTDNPRLTSKGTALLRTWMKLNGLVRSDGRLDTRELARRYRRQAKPSLGVTPPDSPPFAGMLALVEGRSKPRWDTRVCLNDLTDGFVKPEDWDEPPEGA